MGAIAIVGSLARDTVAGAAPRAGGGVFWGAKALAELGAPGVVLARCSAADAALVDELRATGAQVEWRAAASTTAFAFTYDGERRTMAVDEVGEPWTPEDVARWAGPLGDARWIHVAGLLRSDFPAGTLAALAAGGRSLLLDGQGLARASRTGALSLDGAVDPAIWPHVAALKVDEDEAVALAGGADDDSLRTLGVAEVLLTHGSRGSRVVTANGAVDVPADATDILRDPTGAGDAYCVAYAVARAAGAAPVEAAERATDFVPRLLGG